MILISLNYDLNNAQTWFTPFQDSHRKQTHMPLKCHHHRTFIRNKYCEAEMSFNSRSFRRKPCANNSRFWWRKIFWVLFLFTRSTVLLSREDMVFLELLAGKDNTVHLDVWSKACIHAGALLFLSTWSCCGCCGHESGHISFLLQHQTDRKGLLSPQQLNWSTEHAKDGNHC